VSIVASPDTGRKHFTRARSRARRLAMQALYQWQMTGQEPVVIATQFEDDQDLSQADVAYFRELLEQISMRLEAIDASFQPYLDRPIAQVDPVELAILRIGGYELAHRLDIPYRVVINEAVEMAKKFGAEQGHRFVNGVLDKTARQWRGHELQGRG
jgi:N utilization substance protein B